ncbi:2-dehydropantoate 2-reductase [Curtobacterium sp. PhB136]|uniref:ketopantoate reductase family protein n=1 Tax=Curtobacterium sp. PhB136 TaxID=2485181 RepID=UPI0010E48DC0|nr:2-dehydropantoate 2-reductase [Curtobacterium sp. PhB136]TCK65816.1 ketopantoate reductase [Curtobacterium sp. PhB136]
MSDANWRQGSVGAGGAAPLSAASERTPSPGFDVRKREPAPARVALIGAGAIGLAVLAELNPKRASATIYRRSPSTTQPEVRYPDGSFMVMETRQVTDPVDAEPADWVFIATKAHQTASTEPWLRRVVGPDTVVVVLQNGIDHATRVPQLVPSERILPTIVHTVAARHGHIVNVLARNQVLVPPGATFDRLSRLFKAPQLIEPDPDFAANSWRKLILNTAFNSITTITGAPASILALPAVSSLFRQTLREGVRVASAMNVPFRADEAKRLYDVIAALPPKASSSMRRDWESGAPLETDYLSGAVIDAGRRTGVPTPTIDALHGILTALGTYTPQPEPIPQRTRHAS